MRIKVKIRATGAVEEIEESAFDATLHERVEASAAPTVGDMSAADFMAGVGAAVGTAVAEGLRAAGAGQVDRSTVVAQPGRPAPAASGLQVQSAAAARYALLEPWERAIRSEQSDEMCKLWLRGLVNRDPALIGRAIDMLDLSPDQKRVALAEGAAATGGNLLPAPLANLIVAKLSKTAAIGPRGRLFSSVSQTIEIPTENALMAAVGTLEAGTIAESDPTFGAVTLTKRKHTTATRSSRELVDDAAFSVVSILSDQATRAFATLADVQDATAGNGTPPNQTDALANNGSITVVDAAVGALAYLDLTALFYTLPSQYRSNAVWVAENAVIRRMAELVDLNGRPILVNSTAEATPITGGQGAPGVGTVLSRPVVEAPFTAGGLLFGDLFFYGVLEDPGIRVEASTDAAFLADQIVWKFIRRRDGAVLQAEAFKKSGGIT